MNIHGISLDIHGISLDIHGISTLLEMYGISKDILYIYHTYTIHIYQDTICMVYTIHIPGIYQKSGFQMIETWFGGQSLIRSQEALFSAYFKRRDWRCVLLRDRLHARSVLEISFASSWWLIFKLYTRYTHGKFHPYGVLIHMAGIYHVKHAVPFFILIY